MKLFILIPALLASSMAFAQHSHQHSAGVENKNKMYPSPYAGMQMRSIKALSAQQMDDLRAGKGMSLALAAELNGYPGPSHVLELAGLLQLSDSQVARTQRLFAQMKRETAELGERLISAETALDQLFSEKSATWGRLEAATLEAARIQGSLRAAHLRYHLDMAEVLDPAQVREYERLRGYR